MLYARYPRSSSRQQPAAIHQLPEPEHAPEAIQVMHLGTRRLVDNWPPNAWPMLAAINSAEIHNSVDANYQTDRITKQTSNPGSVACDDSHDITILGLETRWAYIRIARPQMSQRKSTKTIIHAVGLRYHNTAMWQQKRVIRTTHRHASLTFFLEGDGSF